MKSKERIKETMKIKISSKLPKRFVFDPKYRRAPRRELTLNKDEIKLALMNALRYIPENLHDIMSKEFLNELKTYGRIYGYRFRPPGKIYGKPISKYKGITEARALQVMIENNLDFEIALYPYELVTYGETGQIFQNWMQYSLVKQYLEIMKNNQTLVISSGHPVGLFKSSQNSPRVIITNALLVGKWDNPTDFKRLAALGVSNYGQMTAGGWMYIGPQGIVHGTFITIINAARKYLKIKGDSLAGFNFVSSGLGGMSCAQPKAMKIAGGVAVIAEVDISRIKTRLHQGWIDEYSDDLYYIEKTLKEKLKNKETLSIAYHGNIVNLLEFFDKREIKVDLLSDQTSCHALDEGGYVPVDLTFEEAREKMSSDPKKFKLQIQASLKRHFDVIKRLTEKGAKFWDYGNSFMISVFESGEKSITKNGKDINSGFIWPSYVEDIMGPMCFDYGFGPFRWVCLSGKQKDLKTTDNIALSIIDPLQSGMHQDNYNWVKSAKKNNLVVGTKARILYSDEEGRVNIALAFNKAVREGLIGPIMIGRDHHDVSGTDSPLRETANIYDGSQFTADMSVQCFAGNIARGMTLVVLSNGGGVGIGRASNGGNGIVLDGSARIDKVIKSGLSWDVMGGVARRNWARNENAMQTSVKWNNNKDKDGHITIPFLVSDNTLNELKLDKQ
jgi:urocanate hydratase